MSRDQLALSLNLGIFRTDKCYIDKTFLFEVRSPELRTFLQRRATLTLIKQEVKGIVIPMLFNQSKFGVYYSVLSLFPARSTCASCKHHIPVIKTQRIGMIPYCTMLL